MTAEAIKQKIGIHSAELVEDGMIVGLGTGTTAEQFIRALAARCRKGLKIQAVASSIGSQNLAQSLNIPLIDIETITAIDMTVDGADEIDPLKRMIKGGGGALVREKIVANMSREMVVIVDESKLVTELGERKLPVEVIPFAIQAIEHKIQLKGYQGEWRRQKDGSFYVTDNGNYLYDITFPETRKYPEKDHEILIHIPGVVDTGFFFDLAGRVVIGFKDGQIVIQ